MRFFLRLGETRLKKRSGIIALLIMTLLALECTAVHAQEYADYPPDGMEPQFLKARVLSVEKVISDYAVPDDFAVESEVIKLELTSAPYKGVVVQSTSLKSGHPAYDFDVEPNDRVIVWAEILDGNIVEAHVFSPDRGHYLKWLVVGFMGVLLLVGGLTGIKTILTLGVTGLAIVWILLPVLLRGYDPIYVTILVSSAITVITLGIVGGFNKKTLTAMIGTTVGVIIAGLIAMIVGSAAHLTGFGTEEATMLFYIPQEVQFDFDRLLFSGMIIGALGAVMDVAMSIASSMEEVMLARPRITQEQLLRSGLRVGRDVMGTMSNTLILAYAGGSIPLLLLFLAYETPIIQIVNFDHIATEIVKALAGSIGLIAAIPITALVGSRLFKTARPGSAKKPASLQRQKEVI